VRSTPQILCDRTAAFGQDIRQRLRGTKKISIETLGPRAAVVGDDIVEQVVDDGVACGKEAIAVIGIEGQGEADLVEVVCTADASGFFAGGVQSGQEQSGKDGDDCASRLATR
jgi:hypothetical protein